MHIVEDLQANKREPNPESLLTTQKEMSTAMVNTDCQVSEASFSKSSKVGEGSAERQVHGAGKSHVTSRMTRFQNLSLPHLPKRVKDAEN